jgi:hypothetical protein
MYLSPPLAAKKADLLKSMTVSVPPSKKDSSVTENLASNELDDKYTVELVFVIALTVTVLLDDNITMSFGT